MKNYIRGGLTAIISIPFVVGVYLYNPYKANAQPYIPTPLPPVIISEYDINKNGVVSSEDDINRDGYISPDDRRMHQEILNKPKLPQQKNR